MSMRDASCSYWFSVGDQVKVVDDVQKAGSSLYGRRGVVVETWEKCDVDPTCCCAEQVEKDMAVRVSFEGTEKDANVAGVSFYHYFAEEELLKLKEEELKSVAFDGASCVDFKLQALGLRKSSDEQDDLN